MKKTYRFIGFAILGVAATTITSVICQVRRKNIMKRLIQAANEGYETAHDIIYPDKQEASPTQHLKYGPYIPKYN